jgi:hypothetical protein
LTALILSASIRGLEGNPGNLRVRDVCRGYRY